MEVHIITLHGTDHILSIVDGVVIIVPPAVETAMPEPGTHIEPLPE